MLNENGVLRVSHNRVKHKEDTMFYQQKHFTLKPLDFDLFIGLDVDKKRISITVVSHNGFLKSLTIPYNSENLISYVRRQFSGKRVAFVYEAGPTGFGLYDDLISAGYQCLVIGPSQIARSASDRVKTNRVDSRKLAERLRGGELRGIQVPTVVYRQLRHLVHLREIFVRERAKNKLRIKAMLLLEGVTFPGKAAERWGAGVIEQLERLPLQATLRFKLDQYLMSLKFAEGRLKEINQGILFFCKQQPGLNKSVLLLKTIPGIGSVVAVYLAARIGDCSQLSNSHQIAGLLGITPREYSTGDRIRKGQISRLGDATTRSKLIETAWTSVRKDPELKEFYDRIRSRHPAAIASRKAVVAVARKLTTRIYAVLKNQRPYVIRDSSSGERAVAEQYSR